MINNRPVGLWMLPAHVGTSRRLLAALQREFNQLRTLEHPHIARMLELGSNGEQYYVKGERLDGEPLREVLTHLMPERLEVGEADDIVRAIGSALAYAHEREIAHGDVRAENVIVTMDRRFMLTNFLARRVAKVSGRPPRPSDDLKGLARLAAELYTGSTSPQALRAAAHGAIPAARLNAIRAVLEGSGRRPGSVAEFLDAAGLALSGAGATLRRPQPPARWHVALPTSLWRLVLPMAAVAAIATLVATYRGDVAASAEELKVRGLDALRAVAARVTPAGQDAPDAAAGDQVALKQAAAPPAEAAPPPADAPRSTEAHGPAPPHGA
ncbi:MAG TPA: protein kinase, partial [Gammaproteobacteria bacterium]